MKLVFVTDAWQPLTGGGQKLYWEVLTRLAKKGWEIVVVTRALKEKGEVKSGLNVIRLGPALSFANPVGRLLFIFQAWIYSLRFNPDVFMATTWLPALTLQLLKLFKRQPVVLLALGFGSRFTGLEDFICKKLKYDLIISDDVFLKQAEFIPNGVDFPPQPKIKKWSDFTFLFVGRNEPRKGMPYLSQAFAVVKKRYPKAKLRSFGPGFKLLSQKDLDREMYQAHCLVLPSLREGHPLILFEAWVHRLPVIATDVGSVSKFLNSGNGYLVEPGNVEVLAAAMIKAIANKRLREMGEAGLNLVKKYTWDKTAASYDSLLKSL